MIVKRKSDFKRKVMHSKLVFPYNETTVYFLLKMEITYSFVVVKNKICILAFIKLIGEKQESIGIYTNDGEYYFIIGVIDGEFGSKSIVGIYEEY